MKRFWEWLKKDGKTTLAAILYASAETILAIPDFSTMTTEDFLKRTVRIVGVTAIGVLARDRKPGIPPTPDNPPPTPEVK